MITLAADRVGPRWAGNQLANYVTELVTACEDRAQELGYEALARPLGCYDPGREGIFEEALQATVTGLRALIAQALQGTWNRDQLERLATNSPGIIDRHGDVPVFSAAPTAGQYVAWQEFKRSLTGHYESRIMPLFQAGLPGF